MRGLGYVACLIGWGTLTCCSLREFAPEQQIHSFTRLVEITNTTYGIFCGASLLTILCLLSSGIFGCLAAIPCMTSTWYYLKESFQQTSRLCIRCYMHQIY